MNAGDEAPAGKGKPTDGSTNDAPSGTVEAKGDNASSDKAKPASKPAPAEPKGDDASRGETAEAEPKTPDVPVTPGRAYNDPREVRKRQRAAEATRKGQATDNADSGKDSDGTGSSGQ